MVETDRKPIASLKAIKKGLKIAHVSATFPPYLAGTGNVCLQNAQGLARRGHQVHVFTAMPAQHEVQGRQDPDELTVHRLRPPFRIGNAPFTPGLLSALRGFDLIHLHYPFYFGAELTWLAAKLYDIPYVITYHQDALLLGMAGMLTKLHHSIMGCRILMGARRLMPTTLDYAQASPWLIPILQKMRERVIPMPNGVDTRRFVPALPTQQLRERYGLSPSDKVALFVGALDRAHFFKGVESLLGAIALLEGPEIKLLIIGDGELRETYAKQARGLGIQGRVIFCGRVDERELPVHYSLADVVVLPSLTMGEAFGLVLIEAMACGVPVVASRLPGVRTVVSDNVDGLLVEPGRVEELAEKLMRLLTDAELRSRMGAVGRKKVEEHYDWEIIAERLEQVYYDVLGRPQESAVPANREVGRA